MKTRNFVPRTDGEGQVGTEKKKWSKVYSDSIYVNNIVGNLTGTADKAIKDNKEQQIDSTYIKNLSVNNSTITATKGDNTTSNIVVNNVSHATNADNATKATNDSDGKAINATYIKKASGTGENLTLANDTFGGQLTVKRNSANAATVKFTNTSNVNRYVGFTASDKIMYKWGDNGDGQTAFLDASNYNNYTPTKTGGGASGTWGISVSGNANTATKATQDSSGQTINTTYVKGVTASNSTITVTKGNGTTSTATINNVSNATNSQVLTEKAITNATLGSALPTGATWTKIYNNGFPCSYGNCLSIKGAGATQLAIEWSGSDATPARMYYRNARDSTIDKWSAWREIAHTGGSIANATTASKLGTATVGSGVKPIYLNAGSPAASGSTVGSANKPVYLNGGTISQCSIDLSTLAPKASPALTGSPTAPTQATSDNSTKLATTAFVQSLLKGNTGGIVGGSLTQNGWVKFSNGLILQWGKSSNINTNSTTTISLPIAYSTIFCALTCIYTNSTAFTFGSGFQIAGLYNDKITVVHKWYGVDNRNAASCFYITIGK